MFPKKMMLWVAQQAAPVSFLEDLQSFNPPMNTTVGYSSLRGDFPD
jgi:hypothetical protein